MKALQMKCSQGFHSVFKKIRQLAVERRQKMEKTFERGM